MRLPAVVLALLAAGSATLGALVPGPDIGRAPHLGLFMLATGGWFGLVVAYGIWTWAGRSLQAAATAFMATCVAWELAVNVALQLDQRWLKATAIPEAATLYISGLAAGAIGSAATWAGAALVSPALRKSQAAARVIGTGAAFGLLLAFTHFYDNPIVLLLPWQVALAASLGAAFHASAGAISEPLLRSTAR